MKRLLNFECNCKFHKVVFEEFTIANTSSLMSICIYEHRSAKTGNLLKKPVLLADVVLDPEQVMMLKSALKNE